MIPVRITDLKATKDLKPVGALNEHGLRYLWSDSPTLLFEDGNATKDSRRHSQKD
jgi:hypothetical protein